MTTLFACSFSDSPNAACKTCCTEIGAVNAMAGETEDDWARFYSYGFSQDLPHKFWEKQCNPLIYFRSFTFKNI